MSKLLLFVLLVVLTSTANASGLKVICRFSNNDSAIKSRMSWSIASARDNLNEALIEASKNGFSSISAPVIKTASVKYTNIGNKPDTGVETTICVSVSH